MNGMRKLFDTETTVKKVIDNSSKYALETILASIRNWQLLQKQVKEFKQKIKTHSAIETRVDLSEIETEARAWLNIVDLTEAAGEHKPQFRFMIRSLAMERVHDRRWSDGMYNSELDGINAGIEAILKREGLHEGEDWPIGEEPDDYMELDEQFSQVLDAKFEETLREFGLVDMANLHSNDQVEYDKLREEGRLIFSDETSELEQVQAVQKQFEAEAEICAEGEAYHAASVMIGSAFESAILFACLDHKDKALKARDKLPKCDRPNGNDPKKWQLATLVSVADEVGWLPTFDLGGGILNTRPLVDMTRDLRNMVHPARHLSDKNKNLDVKSMYDNARAAYVLLKQHLADTNFEQ